MQLTAVQPKIAWLKGDKSTIARVGVTGDVVVIEWPGFLRMTATVHEAKLETLSSIDERIVAKVANGFGRAVPQYLRGAMVFHASAIAVANRGVLFIGESGAGKSTSAALMCGVGGAILSDDTAVATVEGERVFLQPVETECWLDANTREVLAIPDPSDAKSPVPALSVQASPVPLSAIVWLGTHGVDEVLVERIRGVTAAVPLLDAALHIPLGRERKKLDFDALSRILRSVPVFRVLHGARFSTTLCSTFTDALLKVLAS